MIIDITLDQASDAFTKQPNNKTAGTYLEQLMTYQNDDMIGDDTFLDGLAEIRKYLLESQGS